MISAVKSKFFFSPLFKIRLILAFETLCPTFSSSRTKSSFLFEYFITFTPFPALISEIVTDLYLLLLWTLLGKSFLICLMLLLETGTFFTAVLHDGSVNLKMSANVRLLFCMLVPFCLSLSISVAIFASLPLDVMCRDSH